MNYVSVGRTGVKVSELCMGTMTFGDAASPAESKALFAACRDAGITFFDCANVYAGGRSEEILGDLIGPERDELIITSKVFGKVGTGPNDRGLSRRHIVKALEDSLRRLQTDRLDFYFLHQWDNGTPMEESLHALDELVKRGLVLYPAVSNWSAWRTMRALGIQAHELKARFQLMQPMYNLVKRQAEVELLPLAASEGLGVIPYSPLGGGLLTGKYAVGKRPDQGRLVDMPMYTSRYREQHYFEVAERFTDYAAQQGVHPVTLAVAWVKSHSAVTAPILGARNLEQLEPALAAADYDMTEAERADIGALSVEPPPATDRSEVPGLAPDR